MSNERFLMIESDIKNLSFRLESITKSKYDSDWHSTLHTHPFTMLLMVKENLLFNTNVFRLKPMILSLLILR